MLKHEMTIDSRDDRKTVVELGSENQNSQWSLSRMRVQVWVNKGLIHTFTLTLTTQDSFAATDFTFQILKTLGRSLSPLQKLKKDMQYTIRF
jgi:hypothetical protein